MKKYNLLSIVLFVLLVAFLFTYVLYSKNVSTDMNANVVAETEIKNNSIGLTLNIVPEREIITSASEYDYPPFCIVDEYGNAYGFSVELLRETLNAVNLDVEFYTGPWSEIKQDLAEGRIQVLPLVGRTPEREAIYDFSVPYETLYGAIFIRENTTGIDTLSDLKNKKVIVMKGDNAEEFVKRINLSDKIVTTSTYDEAFKLLSDGNYDAIIAQDRMGAKLLEDLNITNVFAVAKIPEFRQDFTFAVKKGDYELLIKLNDGLSRVISSGTFDRLHNKWFPNKVYEEVLVEIIPTDPKTRAKLIVDYDHQLTFSTLNYIATRDEYWKSNYDNLGLKLDNLIIQSKLDASEQKNDYLIDLFKKLDESNIKLVEMELNVHALVKEGKISEANTIIKGTEYQQYKKIYSDCIDNYLHYLGLEVETLDINEFVSESNEQINIVLLKSQITQYANQIDDRFDVLSKIPNPAEFFLMIVKNSIHEDTASFDDKFGIIDNALRTNLSYYSENLGTDDVTGVMLYSNYNITDNKKKMMLALNRDLKTYTFSTNKVFMNRYATFENGIDSMYPNEWIFEVKHNDSFKKDLWYYIADPEHNPERDSKWTPAYYDSVLGYWMVSLITPIYDGDEFIGTTGGDITLNEISDEISNYNYQGQGYSFIFDTEKNIVIHPEYVDEINKKGEMEELFSFKDIKEKGLLDIISQINITENIYGMKNFSDNGIEYLFIYYKLKSIDWYYGFVIESKATQIWQQNTILLENSANLDEQVSTLDKSLPIKNIVYITIIILIITGILLFMLDRFNIIQLKKNTTIILLSLSILILIVIFVFNAHIITKTITTNSISASSEKLIALADSKEQYLELYLEEQKEKMNAVATQSDLTNEELATLMTLQDDFYEIFVLDSNGIIIQSSDNNNIGLDKSNDTYFINGRQTYIKPAYYSESTSKETITISTPFHSGVLVARINIANFDEFVSNREGLGKSEEITMAYRNDDGDAVFFTKLLFDDDNITTNNIVLKENTEIPIMQALLGNERLFLDEKDHRNVTVTAVTRYIEDGNIGLVVKIDNVEILETAQSINNKIWFFTAVIILAMLIIGIVLNFLLTKSLRAEIQNKTRALLDKTSELQNKTENLETTVSDLKNTKLAILNMIEDLSENNKHLKDLDKAKSDFLNIASHELKTPLTAISAYLEILDDYKGQFNPGQLQGLDAIRRNSNQLKMLIGNILEISRLDSGRFELNITEINVKEKVSLLIDNLKVLADNKHIELKYDCDGVEKISTDEMRFEEILNNLVSNAIKFTDAGSITVKTEWGNDEEKDFVVISVIDTGVGIPENKIGELFQNFYQVDATISRRYGGTGLGLAITKKMIELQGGKITVSSVFGKGTTFRFTLPIQPLKKDVSLAPKNIITTANTETVNK